MGYIVPDEYRIPPAPEPLHQRPALIDLMSSSAAHCVGPFALSSSRTGEDPTGPLPAERRLANEAAG